MRLVGRDGRVLQPTACASRDDGTAIVAVQSSLDAPSAPGGGGSQVWEIEP
jgi:hypothetical protein